MVESVYVFRVGQLGDTLVALPAVYELAKAFPGRRFTLITNKPAQSGFVPAWEVMRHTGLFDRKLDYDVNRPGNLFGLAARIRRERGPKVLCYLSANRSARQLLRDRFFYRRVCGFDSLIGLSVAAIPRLRDVDGPLRRLPKHADHLRECLAQELGTDGRPPSTPLLSPPPTACSEVDRLLTPVAGRALLAVGVGSKMPAKKWPLERFIAVIRRLLEQYSDWGVVVLGGPEDRADGDRLVAAFGVERVANLAGKTSVIESAAAMTRCVVYLGNDTGTMHLAASMGLPCVVIFTSRANPGPWEPYGDGHAVLRRDLPCSGCMLTECVTEQMRCLDLIGVDEVWQALSGVLERCENSSTPAVAPGFRTSRRLTGAGYSTTSSVR